jgi:glycosyltransferase involved in cell wall biosynthesis
MNERGVSIIICCYNSEKRLQPTLQHLALLKQVELFPMEVIVVDNASNDNTTQVALNIWNKLGNPYPMVTVTESKAGLAYARERGIASASYEYLVFCDDDNWLSPSYAEEVVRVFEKFPMVAAVGGQAVPEFEVPPPEWLLSVSHSLALGQPHVYEGILEPGSTLFGAGLTLRSSAYRKLISKGFVSLLTDRKGNNLSSGGDSEWCLALQLIGFQLYYNPALSLVHQIPIGRLTWRYFVRLYEAFGHHLLITGIYRSILKNESFPIDRGGVFSLTKLYLENLRALYWVYSKPTEPDVNKLYFISEFNKQKSIIILEKKCLEIRRKLELLQSTALDDNII